MQGRTSFTEEEVILLRLLIRLKAIGGPQAQEALRSRMETLSFYPEDFQLDYPRLDATQFEGLVETGRIRIRVDSCAAAIMITEAAASRGVAPAITR
jgi:hypothetical protein